MAQDNFNISKFLKESVKNSYTNQVAGEEKKELLNENFVGLTPINSIPPRDKENYELAFAKYLGEAEDSKKGNKEEQEHIEGAIEDDKDHIEDLEKDIKDNEEKLAKLKKDYKDDLVKRSNVNEALNPEVSRKVNSFIKAMAERYDYSEQDAVYAIMAALKQRDYDGVNEDLELVPVKVDVEIDDRVDYKNHGVDDEGRMAKSQLYKIAKYASELYKMMEDDTQLDAWVQAKLTKACDYIGSVKHYLEGEEAIDMLGEKKDDEHKG